jgi:hypothetical protein
MAYARACANLAVERRMPLTKGQVKRVYDRAYREEERSTEGGALRSENAALRLAAKKARRP